MRLLLHRHIRCMCKFFIISSYSTVCILFRCFYLFICSYFGCICVTSTVSKLCVFVVGVILFADFIGTPILPSNRNARNSVDKMINYPSFFLVWCFGWWKSENACNLRLMRNKPSCGWWWIYRRNHQLSMSLSRIN